MGVNRYRGLGLHCQGRNFILSHLCLNRRARDSRAQTICAYAVATLPCTLRADYLRELHAATASRDPRNLISTAKS